MTAFRSGLCHMVEKHNSVLQTMTRHVVVLEKTLAEFRPNSRGPSTDRCGIPHRRCCDNFWPANAATCDHLLQEEDKPLAVYTISSCHSRIAWSMLSKVALMSSRLLTNKFDLFETHFKYNLQPKLYRFQTLLRINNTSLTRRRRSNYELVQVHKICVLSKKLLGSCWLLLTSSIVTVDRAAAKSSIQLSHVPHRQTTTATAAHTDKSPAGPVCHTTHTRLPLH